MDKITVQKVNETYLRIDSDDKGILQELSEHFTFDVPGAKYMPRFKMRIWDGKLRLFSLQTKQLYIGLFDKLQEWAKTVKYTVQVIDSKQQKIQFSDDTITPEQIKLFVDSLNIHSGGKKLDIRDYQYHAIYIALKYKRRTVVSPTGSGKSLIQYCIIRYLIEKEMSCMIVVPTTALVLQMLNDFKDYSSENGWNVEELTHIIMGGKEKHSDAVLQVSTWQSIFRLDSKFFNKFDCICCDEVHLAKSSSISGLMEKATEVSYRFGFTGSLDGSKTNQLVIQGLFGAITKVVSTKTLMDVGHLAELKLKCLVLQYNKESKKLVQHMDYQQEIDFLVTHEKRNKFIKNLAMSLDSQITLYFGEKVVTIPGRTEILLSNGEIKLASKITENDDISDDWISSFS